MDVNSIVNSSNLINAYAADGTQNQYASSNVNSANSEVKEVQEIKKDTDNNNSKSKENEYKKKDLDKALKKLNKFLEDDNTRAEYSYHKDLGTLMIKVIDENTNKVILEIPPKKILDMVAYMCKQVGLIDKKA